MGRTTGYLTKEYTATADIPAMTAVKFGAADGTVVPAVAATDAAIGISSEVATLSGEYCSVFMIGNIADVIFGGNVTRGNWLTMTTGGKLIAATVDGQFVIGQAEVSGVDGDIGSVIVIPGTFEAA